MRRLTPLIFLLLLTGCSIYDPPDQASPSPISIPEQWSSQHLDSTSLLIWQDLTDQPQLIYLIQEALANNPKLLATKYNVDIAVAQAKQTEAGKWPKLNAFLEGGRQDQSAGISNRNTIGIDASWEIDFLDKLDDLARAATLQAKQATHGYLQQQLTTIAQISQQWFAVITAQQQYELIKKRLSNLRLNLDIIESGYSQGVNPSLDVYLARADVARALATEQENLDKLHNARRQLEISLGRYPSGSLIAEGRIDVPVPLLPAGIPSTLLQRRHDIQQALLRLEAENYRVANAYKNRFPSLSLSISGGSSSSELHNLLQPESLIWSLFANASAPIFDAGTLAARQEQQESKAKQLATEVTSTTLQAFIEVENNLSAEGSLAIRAGQQKRAADYFLTAEQLAFEQYIAGLIPYITVLESQRSAFDAQTALINIQNSRIQNRISLFLALGGDIPPSLQLITSAKDNDRASQ